jgi:hypothetical protein
MPNAHFLAGRAALIGRVPEWRVHLRRWPALPMADFGGRQPAPSRQPRPAR